MATTTLPGQRKRLSGDPADPVFEVAAVGIGFLDDMTGWFLGQYVWEAHFLLYDTSASGSGKGGSGGRPRNAADSFLTTYHTNSQYWHFYVSTVDTEYTEDSTEIVDVASIIFEDSMQFLHGVDPVQWPDPAQLTAIKAAGGVSIYSLLRPDTILISQSFSIVGDIATSGDVIISGNGEANTVGDFTTDSLGSCHGSFNLTQTISTMALNLTAMEEGGCPTAGTLRYNGTVAFECEGDPPVAYSDTWTVRQTFSGDIITTVVENSTTVWTITDTCGDGSTAAFCGSFEEVAP